MAMAARPPHIETRRLTLRPLDRGDLDAISDLLGDAEALEHWGPPLDRAGAEAWIERNLARYEDVGFGRCAVLLRETGELVGDCGLVPTSVEDVAEVELGWNVTRAQRGRGIATEAAAAWRDHAFAALGLPRIVSMIGERNLPSRRVAVKLGLRLERPALWDGGPMLMYSLARPLSRRAGRSRTPI